VATFSGILGRFEKAGAIAVDIPIGLPSAADPFRDCDREARRKLKPPRASSVFPAPPREVVEKCAGMKRVNPASQIARRIMKKGINAQTLAILPKIREVDKLMNARLQERVFEIHPEVSFWALNRNTPMRFNERKATGVRERLRVLRRYLPNNRIDEALRKFQRKHVARDDVLDAFVAALTALKFADGMFGRFPENPELDSRRLRMEIVYPKPL